MQRSSDRILTTHCGSLPRPSRLVRCWRRATWTSRTIVPSWSPQFAISVSSGRAQADLGVDVINDGEHSKTSFSSYAAARLGGMTPIDAPFGYQGPTRDRLEFAAAYAEMKVMYAARPSNATRPGGTGGVRRVYACTGPITYAGQSAVDADIANLRTSLSGVNAAAAFITALFPTNLAMYHRNAYYATEEEYLYALADAMHVEYQAIVDAGFILQIDDPRLATHYDRHPELSVDECRTIRRAMC